MKRHLLFGTTLWVGLTLFGQEQKIADKAQDYLDASQNQTVIYTGKEQQKYLASIKNHPYLITHHYVKGTLSYDGVVYPQVDLRLDLFRNELILRTPNNTFNVIVQKDKLDYAEFHDLRIVPDLSLAGFSVPDGYYIELYNNQYRVLERQVATYNEQIEYHKLESEFRFPKPVYYIVIGDRIHSFRNEGGLLRILKTNKKELRQYIRRNKLSFKREPRQLIAETVKQYELLNQ